MVGQSEAIRAKSEVKGCSLHVGFMEKGFYSPFTRNPGCVRTVFVGGTFMLEVKDEQS